MSVPTIQALAEQLAAAFVEETRPSGERFTKLRDGSPGWMQDVIKEAHDSARMLPDDWRYQFIEDSARRISEADGDVEDSNDIEEPEADVYNSDLMAWVSSHSYRFNGYCDDALQEAEFTELLKIVAYGQYLERREVDQQLITALTDHLETLDPDADEDDAEEVDA